MIAKKRLARYAMLLILYILDDFMTCYLRITALYFPRSENTKIQNNKYDYITDCRILNNTQQE